MNYYHISHCDTLADISELIDLESTYEHKNQNIDQSSGNITENMYGELHQISSSQYNNECDITTNTATTSVHLVDESYYVKNYQMLSNQHDITQITEEYEYKLPFQDEDEIPSTSKSNSNNYITKKGHQTMATDEDSIMTHDDSYDQILTFQDNLYDYRLPFQDYLYDYRLPFQDEDETVSTSELNNSNCVTEKEHQIMMLDKDETIKKIMDEHKYALPNKCRDAIAFAEKITICDSYAINYPSCELIEYEFGTSLLSWKDGIYSLAVKEIGLGEIESKIEAMTYRRKYEAYGNTNKHEEKNFSVVLHFLEKVFISLVIEEVENVEAEHSIQIEYGMSIEDLRNAAINNPTFFSKLSEKCMSIIEHKVKNDIYSIIPCKMFTTTNINDISFFAPNKKKRLNIFNNIIVDSVSNLIERIVEFITEIDSKFILFSFFGKLCGLYLQRQLLQKIKEIGNRISDNVSQSAVYPGIRSITEINLAIDSYNATGSIPEHSASGFYDTIHRTVYDFKEEICKKIREFRFFYDYLSNTISESSENDILIFSSRLLEYLKYETMCLYGKKIKVVDKINNRFLYYENTIYNPPEMNFVGKNDISLISNIRINSNHLSNGVYSSAIRNSCFTHSKLEESFLLEMKPYIRSSHIKDPDFSNFYSNLMNMLASLVYHKLINLELELSSYVLIPGNNIYTIKQLILSNSYYLNKFSKICEDELDLIRQCDKELSYGISMTKCFFYEKELLTSKSSASAITPRRAENKLSYSPELSLDVLRYAISELPNMLQSTISNADYNFFTSALFKNFNGITIAKRSLQEISALGRNILQSVHENQFMMDSVEYVINECNYITYNTIQYNSLFLHTRGLVLGNYRSVRFFIDRIIFLFEEEIRRLSRESIVLIDNVVALPTEEIIDKLFNAFKNEITQECINSFSEICVRKYICEKLNISC